MSPVADNRTARGRRAEEAAAEYLKALGWRLVARNWRDRRGELDIVGVDDDCLVIVEVRSRSSTRFGTAAESVDARKRARLVSIGGRYVHDVGWSGPWRIDVITFDPDAAGTKRLQHFRSAVSG